MKENFIETPEQVTEILKKGLECQDTISIQMLTSILMSFADQIQNTQMYKMFEQDHDPDKLVMSVILTLISNLIRVSGPEMPSLRSAWKCAFFCCFFWVWGRKWSKLILWVRGYFEKMTPPPKTLHPLPPRQYNIHTGGKTLWITFFIPK